MRLEIFGDDVAANDGNGNASAAGSTGNGALERP
jgi:hypothetical protein